MKAPLAIGAHTSISGGLANGLTEGRRIGAETVQVFTKNASQWRASPLKAGAIEAFRRTREETGIGPVTAHDSYLINLATSDRELARKSVDAFLEELVRAESLGIEYLVTHPGAHKGEGEETGIRNVAEALNRVHDRTADFGVRILLETTAGQGSSLGYRFEHLAEILRRVDASERLGICFDTCHAFAAGYDLRDEEGYRRTFEELDRSVGLRRLRVLHLNDSRRELGSRVDRHEHIGKGRIGSGAFRLLMNDPRFRGLPKILETPESETQHEVNLKRLRRMARPLNPSPLPPQGDRGHV